MPVSLPNKPIALHASRVLHADNDDEDSEQAAVLKLSNRVSNSGHRSYPIGCQLTEDALGIFTLARGEGKLWNRWV